MRVLGDDSNNNCFIFLAFEQSNNLIDARFHCTKRGSENDCNFNANLAAISVDNLKINTIIITNRVNQLIGVICFEPSVEYTNSKRYVYLIQSWTISLTY